MGLAATCPCNSAACWHCLAGEDLHRGLTHCLVYIMQSHEASLNMHLTRQAIQASGNAGAGKG